MLDKKTTEEIENVIEHFNHNFLNYYDYPKDLACFYNKVWVSEESLVKLLNELSDCDEPHRVITLLLKELKGEKE